ncbi:Arc family DNA-binding protein [Massilia rubra]|nr:Arc family DNA-binding protein [Massilia rubra]
MSQIQSGGQAQHNAKDRFILRFHDEGQRAAMKARAAANKRSMNAEILVLIEQGLATALADVGRATS